jgi:hypothetical protein
MKPFWLLKHMAALKNTLSLATRFTEISINFLTQIFSNKIGFKRIFYTFWAHFTHIQCMWWQWKCSWESELGRWMNSRVDDRERGESDGGREGERAKPHKFKSSPLPLKSVTCVMHACVHPAERLEMQTRHSACMHPVGRPLLLQCVVRGKRWLEFSQRSTTHSACVCVCVLFVLLWYAMCVRGCVCCVCVCVCWMDAKFNLTF